MFCETPWDNGSRECRRAEKRKTEEQGPVLSSESQELTDPAVNKTSFSTLGLYTQSEIH